MNVDTLVAGRELDALIAEKVMGLKPCSDPVGRCEAAHMTPCQCWGDGGSGSDLPGYSEWIDYAWQIVEHLTAGEEGWTFKLATHVDGWRATFGILQSAIAPTAPLAICRAALAAQPLPAWPGRPIRPAGGKGLPGFDD